MKKKFISILMLLSLIGIFAIVSLVTMKVHQTFAQNDGQELGFTESKDVHDVIDEPVELNENISQPTERNLVLETPSVELALSEIESLNDKWTKENKVGGWLHLVSSWKEDYDGISTLPDGRVLEKEYTNDEWYLFDESGKQVKAVIIRRDLSGNPSQVSILRDSFWYNLTYGGVPVEALSTGPLLDYGFSKEAAEFTSIDRQETSLDGKPALLFTNVKEYPIPVKAANYNEAITAIAKRAYFDPESGALLSMEVVDTMASGEKRVFYSIRLVTVEREQQPPTEVLNYLEQELKP